MKTFTVILFTLLSTYATIGLPESIFTDEKLFRSTVVVNTDAIDSGYHKFIDTHEGISCKGVMLSFVLPIYHVRDLVYINYYQLRDTPIYNTLLEIDYLTSAQRIRLKTLFSILNDSDSTTPAEHVLLLLEEEFKFSDRLNSKINLLANSDTFKSFIGPVSLHILGAYNAISEDNQLVLNNIEKFVRNCY